MLKRLLVFIALLLVSTEFASAMQRVVDHYAVLGVARNAPQREIRRAYKSMAAKWHPDKNKSPEATAMFQKINEAHEVLCELVRKAAYDATLRRVASESESESESELELGTDEGSQESSEESRCFDDSDEESVESADEFEEDESDDNESEIEAMFGEEAAKLASYGAPSREEAAELKQVYLNTVFKKVYRDTMREAY